MKMIDKPESLLSALATCYKYPIHVAAVNNAKTAVRVLLAFGDHNPNVSDETGLTPLHIAAGRGHVDLCELLLKAGAGVNAPNNDGQTPLFCAVFYDKLDSAKLLLENHADALIIDREGRSLLDICKSEEVEKLINAHMPTQEI